jgi:hypothetical protein
MRAYKLLSILGDIKAARRGPPGPLVRRQARKEAHRGLARILRR